MRKRTLDLNTIIIPPHASLQEALACLDRTGIGALAVCDDRQRLIALLTDGDIRRALLRSIPLETVCRSVAHPEPITLKAPVIPGEALFLMNKHDINHLPVVDADGRLLDLLRRNDLVTEGDRDIHKIDRTGLATIASDLPIGEVFSRLDLAGTGALLLCDANGILQGLVTDGDLRRAVLKDMAMDMPCASIASQNPITATHPLDAADALHIMNEHDINHLPILDAHGRVMDFLLRKDLVSDQTVNLSAVIMAGGYGSRLMPMTEQVPKPMLPLGDRPLLERTIRRLSRAGITDVHVTTHHLSEQIKAHFGDGEAFGIRLKYAHEEEPLGTAGGLKRLVTSADPLLVLNGDVLTGLAFDEMLTFHRRHQSELTVGVRKYEISVPFGVVECDDIRIKRLREKPVEMLFINAGVYLLERSVVDFIPDGVKFDMTDLIHALLEAGRAVISYPILEYWIDIGRPEDYRKAQDDMLNGTI
jgi:dTDP-glucose pyrophosphorylase/CBS domain-containing protein